LELDLAFIFKLQYVAFLLIPLIAIYYYKACI
jgi:hypothetical protein